MRRASAVAVLIGLLGFMSVRARAGVQTGPVVDPANGFSYYLLDSASWTDSQTEAQSMGGNLAIITNAAENTWIFNTFDPTVASLQGDMWIGFYDSTLNDGTASQHAADFKWIDGTPVAYTNWSAGEPNDDPNLGGEYYACMVGYAAFGETPGEWNDKTNNGSLTPSYAVVQVPEPVGFALAIGAVIFLHMSRTLRPYWNARKTERSH